MTTDPMTEDMRLVAAAYREQMLAGRGEIAAWHTALEAYMARYPEKPADKAGSEVTGLILEASSKGADWICGRE
jgi:hypothetical protein